MSIKPLEFPRLFDPPGDQEMAECNASTKVWIAKAGQAQVDISNDAEGDSLLLSGSKSSSSQDPAQGGSPLCQWLWCGQARCNSNITVTNI
jgi:hypothetical protein